jgi:hypothetical protein
LEDNQYFSNRSKSFWVGHREGFQGQGARPHSPDALEQRQYFLGYSHGQTMRTNMEMIANELGLDDELTFPVVAAMAIEAFIKSR